MSRRLTGIRLKPLGSFRSQRFLSLYSPSMLMDLLEVCGFFKILPRDIELETWTQGPSHVLHVKDQSGSWIWIQVRLESIVFEDLPQRHWTCLSIEELKLQNPHRVWSSQSLALPGQKYPPSGLSPNIWKLVRFWQKHLNLDLIFVIPEYFHNAVIYEPYLKYYSPIMRDFYAKAKRLFQKTWPRDALWLPKSSWAFELSCIFDSKAQLLLWPTEGAILKAHDIWSLRPQSSRTFKASLAIDLNCFRKNWQKLWSIRR